MLTWSHIKTWLGADVPDFVAPAAAAPQPTAFVTDSRTIGAGEWFVPLTGEIFDGHKFIAAAMAKGAAGFFYARSRAAELPPELRARGIAVTEPLAAMQAVATGWRHTLKDLTLIALTGSTGKTTTKEMLGAILRSAGATYATEASFNNEIGVPKTLLQLTPQHRFAAVEFGARMPGNIRFLCELADPDVVGLINVGMTHVGIFGTVEKLLATKLEIFADSGPRARQVALHDDPRILAGARATGKPTLSFGSDHAADVALLGAEWSKDGTMQISLRVRGEAVAVRLGVAHAAYPINAAAAAAMATAAGIAPAHIAAGLAGFTGIKGRFQLHRRDGVTIIDDTYNASPDSMRAGLATVARSFADARKVLVLGDMLELGDCSPSEHRKLGTLVAQLAPAHLVTVGLDARLIAESAQRAGFPSAQTMTFGSVDELLAARLPLLAQGEVLYAKASHGIGLDKLINNLLNRAGTSV